MKPTWSFRGISYRSLSKLGIAVKSRGEVKYILTLDATVFLLSCPFTFVLTFRIYGLNKYTWYMRSTDFSERLPRETIDFVNIFALWHSNVSYCVMFCYMQLLTFIIITANVYSIRGAWASSATMLIFAQIMPWNRTNIKPLLWCHVSHWQTDYIVLVLNITASDALETLEDRASASIVLILFAQDEQKMTCRIKSDVNG